MVLRKYCHIKVRMRRLVRTIQPKPVSLSNWPVPRTLLLILGPIALGACIIFLMYAWDERKKGDETWEVKQGWMTLDRIKLYMESNEGRWPSSWDDLGVDRSKSVAVDFSLTLEKVSQNPDLVFGAVKLKKRPDLEPRLQPDFIDFRAWLKEKYTLKKQFQHSTQWRSESESSAK